MTDRTKPDGNEADFPTYDAEVRENVRGILDGDDNWVVKLTATKSGSGGAKCELFNTPTVSRTQLACITGDSHLTTNGWIDPAGGGSWFSFDNAKVSWSLYFSLSGDKFAVRRGPATAGAIAWVESLSINSSGYVFVPARLAIGSTTSPSNQLEVLGGNILAYTTTVGSINTASIQVQRGDSANGYAQMIFNTGATNNFSIGMRAGDSSLRFFDAIANATRFLIDASGNLLPGASNSLNFGASSTFLKTLFPGRIQTGAATPTVTGTGGGSGVTYTVETGSSDLGAVVTITAGSGAATSGTIALIFSTSNGAYGTNNPVVIVELANGTGTWNARATAIVSATISTTGVTINWDNNAVALTNGSTYKLHVHVFAK